MYPRRTCFLTTNPVSFSVVFPRCSHSSALSTLPSFTLTLLLPYSHSLFPLLSLKTFRFSFSFTTVFSPASLLSSRLLPFAANDLVLGLSRFYCDTCCPLLPPSPSSSPLSLLSTSPPPSLSLLPSLLHVISSA